METRVTEVLLEIEIGLYLAHYSGMHCYIVSIGLFQFSSKNSVTHAFYTTIGQSYIPTNLLLKNVLIYLFHKFFFALSAVS